MIADPDSLRAESFHQVGALLQNNVEPIIVRWCERAAVEQPHALRVHHDVLRDHLPELIRAIGRSLAASDNGGAHHHSARAARHGGQRWQDGWSLDEVVRDYQILRRVILEYLDEQLRRPLSLRENLAIGLALDEAISDSVQSYGRSLADDAGRQQREEADRLR